MESPNEYNKRKGVNVFALRGRYLIIKKLAYIIKLYQDNYRNNINSVMFRMRAESLDDKEEQRKPGIIQLYENRSYSLFQ